MIRFDGSEAHRRLETFPGKLCISFFLLFLPFRFIFYSSSPFVQTTPSSFPLFFFPLFFPSPLSSLLSLHFHSNLSLLLILPKKNFLPSPSFSSSSSFSPFLPSSTNIQLFISSEYKFIQPLLPFISLPPSFVHRSLPLSSPNTPSTSSLSSSPLPSTHRPTLPSPSRSGPLSVSVLPSPLPSPPLPIHPTRFRPTFSSRRIDRAESASPIPAYIYRVLYYYAVHPVYIPRIHTAVPRCCAANRARFSAGEHDQRAAPRRAATGTGSATNFSREFSPIAFSFKF